MSRAGGGAVALPVVVAVASKVCFDKTGTGGSLSRSSVQSLLGATTGDAGFEGETGIA